MAVITRKIEIYINCENADEKKAYKDKFFSILYLAHKFYNLCASHLYFADNHSQFLYYRKETISKLTDGRKSEEGMLVSSASNMLYEMSKSFTDDERKGLTKILADIANRVTKTYNSGTKGQTERDKIRRGEISVKNYKQDIPIPFSKQAIDIRPDNGNYIFDFYHIPFRTKCGADRSGNRIIVDRALAGEYEICDSSIQYIRSENKTFLLLTVKINNETYDPVPGKKAYVELGLDVPMVLRIGDNLYEIGNKEEYLYRKLQIQAKLRRLQKDLKYNVSGGRGRETKLQAIDRFHEKEKLYVQQKIHVYSRELVNICRKNKVETIILANFNAVKDIIKDDPNHFLLRNWGYFGLTEKIKYKSSLIGLNVETE